MNAHHIVLDTFIVSSTNYTHDWKFSKSHHGFVIRIINNDANAHLIIDHKCIRLHFGRKRDMVHMATTGEKMRLVDSPGRPSY